MSNIKNSDFKSRKAIVVIQQARALLAQAVECWRNLIVIEAFCQDDEDEMYFQKDMFTDYLVAFMMRFADLEVFRKYCRVSRNFRRRFRRLEKQFRDNFFIFSGYEHYLEKEDYPELAGAWWRTQQPDPVGFFSEKDLNRLFGAVKGEPSGCPDVEKLLMFAAGELECEEHFRLGREHIRDCFFCRLFVQDFLAAEKEAKKQPKRPLPEWLVELTNK